MNHFKNIVLLIARLCISSLFIWAAIMKILQWQGTLDYMATRNMPLSSLLLPAVVGIQLLGGLSIALGFKGRWGALALIIFIIPAALIFHNFWDLQGNERNIEAIMFMNDVAILGGLLQILIYGTGVLSLDNMLSNPD